jgi:hypothetical protein
MPGLAKSFIISAAIAVFGASAANAKTYQFRVNCTNEVFVALWDASSNDPGEDYFRIATGDANLDCSVYDYNTKGDRSLPRRWCSYPGGIIRGFPPILILSGLSHCR